MMGTGWVLNLLMCDSRRNFGVHLKEPVPILVESESESPSVVSDSLRVHGILQVRILEWVAFPFSRGSSQPRDLT